MLDIRGQAGAVLIAFRFLGSPNYTQGRWMRLVDETGLDARILEAIRELETGMEVMLFGGASGEIELDTYRQRVECVRMRDLLLRLLMSRIARRAERITERLAECQVLRGHFGSIPSSPRREIDGGSPQAGAALEGIQDRADVPDQAEFTPALPWETEKQDWSVSVIDAVLSGQATEAPTAPYLADVVTWTAGGTEVIKKMWRESFGIQPMPPDRPRYLAFFRGQPYCFMCCKMATQVHLDSSGHSRRVRNYVEQYPSGYCKEYYRRCNALLLAGSIPVCQIQSPHPHNPRQE